MIPKLTASENKILQQVFLKKLEYQTPVQWAEANRVMSSSESRFKGKFSYDRNPYLKEIVDHLQSSSPAHKIAVMKGAQIGFSTGVIENGIGWIIKHAPSNILISAGDETLVKDAITSKIDKMIDSSGLRPLIRNTTNKKRNMQTGDTNKEKQFPGGTLRGRSLQNAGNWRQFSVKYLFVDDIDAGKRADKKEGSTVELINQRAASFGDSAKILYISTPTTKQESLIEPLYLQGDQRKFFVPCPCCGEFIPLEFQLKIKNKYFGIVWDVDQNGNLITGSTRYRCQSCEREFKEDGNKATMLRNGFWKPTAEPKEPNFYSYHISALYSPPGMFNWEHYARQFIKAMRSDTKDADLKTFNNVVLGKTWEAKKIEPKANKISKNTREYEIGIVPNKLSNDDGNGDIILVTCACDLNGLDNSNAKYDYDDARLDYEITAHSQSGATYSIDQGSIGTFQRRKKPEGRVLWSYKHDVPNSVWPEFANIITKQYTTDEGRPVKIAITGVDVGAYSQYVWMFIERMQGQGAIIGLKGDTEVKKVNLVSEDQAYFTKSKMESNMFLLRTNLIKNNLANYMQLEWQQNSDQPDNFMNFPQPSDGKYTVKGFFQQYESEEKKFETNIEGLDTAYKWGKKMDSSQNHFWDCRVYNLALANILMHLISQESKIKYPTWSTFCELMKN